MYKVALLLIAACAAAHAVSDKKRIVGCYFASWATYRTGEGKYSVSDINPVLCSHLFYSFIGLNGDDASIKILDPWLDVSLNGYRNFTELRKLNPSAKIMVAIGGWNEGSANYSKFQDISWDLQEFPRFIEIHLLYLIIKPKKPENKKLCRIVTDATLRAKFADNVIAFLKERNFDGLDLDWEYPAQRGGLPSDKENLILLLKELKEKFEKEKFILSMAVAPCEKSALISYNITEIAKNVDFINLMTYDFHSSADKEGLVRHNTPLYAAKDDTEELKKWNINTCVNYWISAGAPSEKLILGTAFYGKTYTLADPKKVGRNAPFSGPGAAGIYTKNNGTLAYYEIVDLIKNQNWTVIFDDEQKVPYAYKNDQIVAFENVKSMKIKAEYAVTKKLGGTMTWSIDTDDFKGISGEKYPLLNCLNV